MAPTLDRIDHIHVFVADRAAAERWYADVLGLRRIDAMAFWSADGGPLTIGNTSDSIHLALFERAAEKCRSTIALGATAAEFLAWRAHLAQVLGRPLDAVDHHIAWSIYFSDPDGNPFEITSYDHAPLAAEFRADDLRAPTDPIPATPLR